MSTILIVDDNAFVRRNVRSIIDRHSTIQVCGEAQDGENALQSVTELRPDIVLLDVDMPRMSGIEAAQRIYRLCPSTKVVFFSIHPASLFRRSGQRSQGFVSKLSVETDLIPTLDRLEQTSPAGVLDSIRYEWQHLVVQAFTADGHARFTKLELAEHAIAERFTDVVKPDRDERTALTEALQALRKLRSESRCGPEAEVTGL
jgi:CheY-like chemotaxis protein